MTPAAGLRPVWEREGRDWPHREHSRFIHAAGRRWHVQVWGRGPVLLLVHGTGASTHSWRDVASLLTDDFTLVIPDLPGHGFSEAPVPSRLSLPGMAWGLKALLTALGVTPMMAAGHSAGVAVLLRMCLDGAIAPSAVVSFNGALLPLRGVPGTIFAPLARLFASVPLVSMLLSWRALDRNTVEKLIRDTGSSLRPEGVDYYARLMRSAAHVQGALGMMARWNLRPLEHDLPRLKTRLVLLVGENDKTIPAAEAQRVAAIVPGAVIVRVPGTGHLMHEERPEIAARAILDTWRQTES